MFNNKNIIYVDIENNDNWIEMMTILESEGYKWNNCRTCNKMQGIAFTPISNNDMNYNNTLFNVIKINPNSNLITRITRGYYKGSDSILFFKEFLKEYVLNLDWARNIINSD